MRWLDRVYASPINYYGGFTLDVVVATILIASGGAAPGALVAGFLTYTFYEYVIHRWVYHHRMGTVQRLHTMHHDDKTTQFGAPFFMTMSIAALSYTVARAVASREVAESFAGSILGSYAFQSVIHHIAHGWSGTSRIQVGIVRACRRRHMLHHRDDAVNFGILSSIWDHVFRTHARRPRPRVTGSC